MKGKGITRKARYGILAAIMAGTFSIMPAAQALPLGGASDTAVINRTSSSVMDITSSVTNNLLTWQDFSIAKGETVNFGGANTYLNVVIGNSQSVIDGLLSGPAANVYLINPNGILIGSTGAVNVGSLHLSTAEIDASKLTDFDTAMAGLSNPVVAAAGDIVNKGTLTAAKAITVDGNNVTFKNVADVKAGTALTVKANSNEFHVGRTDDSAALTLADGSTEAAYYKLVSTAADLQAIDNDLTVNYMLANDIDMTGVTFTPIGNDGSSAAKAFSGKFDGIGHVLKNLTINVNYGTVGLFSQISGKVENVGLEEGSISGGGAVGGIAGQVLKTGVIQNVYNNKVSVNGTNSGIGGLVGNIQGGKILNAYNTGDVTLTLSVSSDFRWAGGIVGCTGWNSGTTIKNVYNTGKVTSNVSMVGGIVGQLDKYGDVIENAYNTGAVSGSGVVGGIVGNYNSGQVKNAFYTQGGGRYGTAKTEAEMKQAATFTSWGTVISSDGVDRSAAWRICEGTTMPMLTAFMARKDKIIESIYDGTYDAGYVISSAPSVQESNQTGTNWVKDVNAVISKPVTVSFAAISKVYDGTATATAGTATLDGLVEKDKEKVSVTAEAAYDQKDAGSRTVNYTAVTLSGEKAIRNYALNDTATGTGAITAAPLTLTVADTTKVYDGTTAVMDGKYTITAGQLFGTDALSGGVYAYDTPDVGTGKTVSLTGITAGDNYELTVVNSTNSSITAKAPDPVNPEPVKPEPVVTEPIAVIAEVLEDAGTTMAEMEAVTSVATAPPPVAVAAVDSAPATEPEQTENNKESDGVETAATTATTHGDNQGEAAAPAGEKQVVHNALGGDGLLTIENEGITPPESMSADSVAEQQNNKKK